LNVGSLFSGIGGIELGLERAGDFNTLWFIENDKHAQTILKKHWPTAIIYDDITTIDFKSIPRIDILTGGFPCQDISNAGKRAGITGSRSSLWKHYLRAIRILRPKYIIAENVAALINRGLDTVLADLASVGYDAEWHCISASSVGAPHRRDRVFIIGIRTSIVAYTDEFRNESLLGCSFIEWWYSQDSCPKSISSSFNVANSDIWRWNERSEQQYNNCTEWSICSYKSNYANKVRSIVRSSNSFNRRWAVEPNVGRVAYGIPFRMDRIKRLGNAVVPRVAQVIGEAIQKREDTKARECVGECGE
jgi:DNA (cytosine-5)-methyltransferase 1